MSSPPTTANDSESMRSFLTLTGFDDSTEVHKFHATLLQILGILEFVMKTQTAERLRSKDKDVSRAKRRKLCRMMWKEIETVSWKLRSFRTPGDPNQLKAYDSKSLDADVPAVESCMKWCDKISSSLKATSYMEHGFLSWKYLWPDAITRDSDKRRTKEALDEIHSFAELLRLTVPSPSSPPAATNSAPSSTPLSPPSHVPLSAAPSSPPTAINSAPSTTPPIAPPAIGAPVIGARHSQFCLIDHAPITPPAIGAPVIGAPVIGARPSIIPPIAPPAVGDPAPADPAPRPLHH
ncbi:hypothetical protein MSAN_00845700 [Mycena sanguinolenta]|uniref:Uncharacterized protein n=1 Tax=Mycena sanguinolenta TaxID=230812 RepID=A0A8H6YYW7_9AGAR|nr:hypothetical protein MSAN_00845700 [Mycena sanguinolenta]